MPNTTSEQMTAGNTGRSRKHPGHSEANNIADGVMVPPESGVKIRMYRQGHGDCFLLAFRQQDGSAFYMLIDCGMKKGSSVKEGDAVLCTIREVVEDIGAATGNHLHLVVVTHEHEDHVSGFLSQKKLFEQFRIDKLWLAWTEDPQDPRAARLREKYHDTLLSLIIAADRLAAAGGRGSNGVSEIRAQGILESLLGFEISEAERTLAAADPARIEGRTNKEAILVVKRQAEKQGTTDYLRPHAPPRQLANVPGVRIFVLGPPEDEAKLRDMDPQGDEAFPDGVSHSASPEERAFLAATGSMPAGEEDVYQPFDPRHRIPRGDATHNIHGPFFEEMYGLDDFYPEGDDRRWRRIDTDWLMAAEEFALRMNNFVNNTSLVLAIELPRTKKVLLFVGDAQRGNWLSWGEKTWTTDSGLDDGEIDVKDLLRRTVFYKVGHHGSHNATLNEGGLQNMALGRYANDFVAMIPAHEKWALALTPVPWVHPLPAILKALREKARGRVLVLDRNVDPPAPEVLSPQKWAEFQGLLNQTNLFYEFTVEDQEE
jgi:hypothetical protein